MVMSNSLELLRLYLIFTHQLSRRSTEVSCVGKSALDLIDERYKSFDVAVSVSDAVAILRPIFPSNALNDEEMMILIQNIFTGAEANFNSSVNMSQGMLLLRQYVPYTSWQLLRIVQSVRFVLSEMRAHNFVSRLEQHVRDYLYANMARHDTCSPDAEGAISSYRAQDDHMFLRRSVQSVHACEVHDFLVQDCSLSYSQSQILVQYVSSTKVNLLGDVGCGSSGSSLTNVSRPGKEDGDAAVDIFLLHDLIFADTMPSDVEYPLLAAQLAEATQVVQPGSKTYFSRVETVGIDSSNNSRMSGIGRGRSGSSVPSGSCDTARNERAAQHTGSMALLHALRSLSLAPCARGTGDDLDFGAFIHCTVTRSQFSALCDALGAWSMCAELRRRLFTYMRASFATAQTSCTRRASSHDGHHSTQTNNENVDRYDKQDATEEEQEECVSVRTIVRAYRQFLPPVSATLVQLICAAVRACLARAGDELVYVKLFAFLGVYGAGRVPLEAYIAALRQYGVTSVWVDWRVVRSTSANKLNTNSVNDCVSGKNTFGSSGGVSVTPGVPDLALEWMRLEAPTRVDLLYTLCHPVPSGVQAVVQKVFDSLDEHRSGRVPVSTVLARFDVNKMTAKDSCVRAVSWRTALMQYLDIIGDDSVDYDLFAYFCFMLAAGVGDEPAITMIFWRCFGLSERVPSLRRTIT